MRTTKYKPHSKTKQKPQTRKQKGRKRSTKVHKTRRRQRGGRGSIHALFYQELWEAFKKDSTTHPEVTVDQLAIIDMSNIVVTDEDIGIFNNFIEYIIRPAPNPPQIPLAQLIKELPPALEAKERESAIRNWQTQRDRAWRRITLPMKGILPLTLFELIAKSSDIIHSLTINNPNLTDADLVVLYNGIKVIDYELNLAKCTGLTRDTMYFVQAYEPVILNLSDLPTMTDDWLEVALGGVFKDHAEPNETSTLHTPNELYLNNNPNLTNYSAQIIVEANLPTPILRRLEVQNNPNIDQVFLASIAHPLDTLRYINLEGSNKLLIYVLTENTEFNPFQMIGLEKRPNELIWYSPHQQPPASRLRRAQ